MNLISNKCDHGPLLSKLRDWLGMGQTVGTEPIASSKRANRLREFFLVQDSLYSKTPKTKLKMCRFRSKRIVDILGRWFSKAL